MHPILKMLRTSNPCTIHVGDCIESMRLMPEKSVQCCVTSPPYFGLRSYGEAGAEIGKEKTPAEFVASLVAVFREVRRVLKDDGTVWLNLGDSYAGSNRGSAVSDSACEKLKGDPSVPVGRGGKRETWTQMDACPKIPEGLKPKDLIGIPWRVAFALQDDGWYLRQDIIWHKPNPMPESVRDRCTKAHEYIFLLAKKPKYYFDSSAIKEPEVCGRKRGPALHGDQVSTNGNGGLSRREGDGKRNKRSVWTVTTKPYKGAHFATFPPDLIEPCILAGSRPGDMVLDPFGGSGTTAQVALKHGRQVTLCELYEKNLPLIEERISKISR